MLSKLLFRQVWRLGRLLGSRGGKTIEMAGPVGMLLCVLVWTVLVVIGFRHAAVMLTPGQRQPRRDP